MVRPWPDWPDQSLRAWKRGKEKIKLDQRNEKGGGGGGGGESSPHNQTWVH